MSEIIYRHNEKCKFLTYANGLGKAIVYKNLVDKLNVSETTLSEFIEKLQLVVDEEMIIARPILSSQDLSQSLDGILMECVNIIHKTPFIKQFKALVLNQKYDVRKAFLDAFESNRDEVLNKKYTYTPRKDIEDILEYTRKRILSLINKVIIKEHMMSVKEDFIFVTEDFQTELFDGVSKHLKGVICTKNHEIGEPNAYSIDFGFPLVVCNQPIADNQFVLIDATEKIIVLGPSKESKIKHLKLLEDRRDLKFEDLNFKSPNFKLFASTVDTLSIDTIAQSNNYHGICSFRSEYYYGARGITPSLEEQTVKFIDIIQKMSEKEVFFEVPHFDHNVSLDVMGDDVTDLEGVDRQGKIFEVFFDAVAAASAITKKQLNIIIPMLMRKQEIDEWLMHIRYHFDKRKAPKPNIGGALESEIAIMYGTDFRKLDFVIIGLDDLYDEIDEDYKKLRGNSHIEMIDPISIDDLRRIHKLLQGLKNAQRHILHGDILTNPDILHKFLKRGFKEFAIPVNKMYLVHDVFRKHFESVGKYVGYRAMMKAKKLAKASDDESDDDDTE